MPRKKYPICTITPCALHVLRILRILQPIIRLAVLLLLCVITLFFPLDASASTGTVTAGGPSLNISAGFNARYRDGNWFPVQVTLSNNGPDFTGTIAIPVPVPYSGSSTAATLYKTPISLATGAQKQLTLYIPLSLGASGSTQNLTVNLLDNHGQTIRSQTTMVRALGLNDIFVGLLSDQTAGFGPLNAVSLPNQTASLVVEPLNATTFPTTTNVLKNFDLLILDNFTTSTLSPAQLTALQGWVNQGGTLLIAGGPEWRHTLTGLPADLLPVTVSGTQTLTTATSVLPIGSPGNGGVNEQNVNSTVTGPFIVSTAAPTASSTTLLSAGTIPLLVQGQYGQGSLYYMAFDPTLNPIANWSHASLLWQGLLLRALGDQLLTQNPVRGVPGGKFAASSSYDMSGLLQSFLPNTFPSISLILAILCTYILVLGPMRYFIVRRLKKRDWSWRIVLTAIVLFSVLSYAIALQQKGTTVVSDTISVLQLGQMQNNQTQAHEITYVGVFVPSNGDFHIDVGNNYLVQPANSQFGASTASQNTTITDNPHGIDTELQGVNIWTMHSVEAEQDRALHGGIISHLTLQNGTLTGTITNTLSYALDDVYVLMASSYVSLGQVGAGQTQQVTIALNTNGDPNSSLAEQIAGSNGISGPAFGGYSGQPPQTELTRHISMLSALSGDGPYYCGGGGFCYGPAYKVVTSNGVMITSNGGTPSVNSQDPLLLPDAPATLIGWSDTPSSTISNVTINGNQPSGAQEVMLQAPLDVNLAGNVTLPTSFVDGHMVDVQNQSANIQVQLPGIYTMTTGSVTFEMTIPNNAKLHVTSATISEPSDINQALQASGASPGTVSDVSSAQVNVYNWQTGKWDTVTVSNGIITLANPNAYIGSNGRVLLQISNQDASKGTIAFSAPTLQVQGNAR